MTRTFLVFLVFISSAFAQTRTANGRIEGVVLEAGGASPQPVGGARITVTKVNATNGQSLPTAGRAQGISLSEGPSTGALPMPGMTFDSEPVRRYESSGKAVHVEESAKLNVEAKIIRAF